MDDQRSVALIFLAVALYLLYLHINNRLIPAWDYITGSKSGQLPASSVPATSTTPNYTAPTTSKGSGFSLNLPSIGGYTPVVNLP